MQKREACLIAALLFSIRRALREKLNRVTVKRGSITAGLLEATPTNSKNARVYVHILLSLKENADMNSFH